MISTFAVIMYGIYDLITLDGQKLKIP